MIELRSAAVEDLPVIGALLRESLVHDRFSVELLEEKLFPRSPHPEFSFGVTVAMTAQEIVGVLQHVSRPSQRRAWIGLFGVAPDRSHSGIASRMLEAALDAWRGEVDEVEALAIPGNYFTPGLDPRYTAGLSFLERRGFERFKDCTNLRVSLAKPFDVRDEQRRVEAEGLEVRRAAPGDEPRLDAFFDEHFGADWRYESELAFRCAPPALHLVLRDEAVIAFSAHSTQNREWGFFGPMGSAPAARGRGLGRVLLQHCLNDLREAGHTSAIIPWVGPIAFYHRWVGAVVDRVFWRYRRQLVTNP